MCSGPREALNFLKETLRCHRNKSTTIEATFAKSIVAEIENGGDDLFDRLEVPVFCIVIDTILQSDYCREGERGINLLAVRLPFVNHSTCIENIGCTASRVKRTEDS